MSQIPLLLTLLRAGLAPVVVLLALFAPVPVAFAACLAVAAVSDYFDGAIARHLNIVTPRLRRLDSVVDLLFHLAALFALWWLYPQVIARHAGLIAVLCGLGVARYAVAYARFGREASYHLWSSKVWGFALFLAFYSLLVLQSDGVGITLVLALGVLAGLEDLAVSVVLREWRADVPTLVHAWRFRLASRALDTAQRCHAGVRGSAPRLQSSEFDQCPSVGAAGEHAFEDLGESVQADRLRDQ